MAKRTVDGGITFIVFIAEELPVDVHIQLAFEGQQHVVSTHSFHSGTKLPIFLDDPPFSANHFTVDVTVFHGNTHSAPFVIESNGEPCMTMLRIDSGGRNRKIIHG